MSEAEKHAYTLPLADVRATLERVGGKGASLARLVRAGLPVPDGFHVTTTAYRDFVDANNIQALIESALHPVDVKQPHTLEAVSEQIRSAFARGAVPGEIAQAIGDAYRQLGDVPVAVRSSATAEDLPGLSFAGQQETFLNMRGSSAVLDAVKRCWASLWTARAIGYRAQHQIDQQHVSLAVVVQQLVPAEAAGVLFTANPMNGDRQQIVMNAVWGLGEAMVSGLVTPDSLVLDKTTQQVLTREISDKQLMTARAGSGTFEQPVPAAQRRAPVLDDAAAAELARLGVRIEQLFGRPVDVEWARAAGVFNIVQARPITALREPELPAPAQWRLPDPKAQYYRASIVELLPDPLTPLFATLGRAAINHSYKRFADAVFGDAQAWPSDILVTINDYAFYGIRTTARLLGAAGRALSRLVPMLAHADERWAAARPRYAATVERWRAEDLQRLSAIDSLSAVREVLEAAFDHYITLQSGIIPVAYMSETLFTEVYNRLLKGRDGPPALKFMLGFDSAPIRAEKSLDDLAQWTRAQPPLAAHVLHTSSATLVEQLHADAPYGMDASVWQAWRDGFHAHLAQFGHAIYDLDFAKPLPADDPAPLLDTFKFFVSGRGNDPYARQRKAAEERTDAMRVMRTRLAGLRRSVFDGLLSWAQRYAPLREDGLADVGLGWPLVRAMLRECGERLANVGMIADPGDVFWLEERELESAALALDGGAPNLASAAELVILRKQIWRAEKRATPPSLLPERAKWLGMDLERWMPARDRQQGDTIKGIGASPGKVSGVARVLRGPDEFNQMQHGDILVAAITTPAWTPLFALASGVVTDVGGPLSHSSIVAREYGIPAVLGTGVATRRIQSGQRIMVDGDVGTVTFI